MPSQYPNPKRCAPSASTLIPLQKRRKLSQDADNSSDSASLQNPNTGTQVGQKVLHQLSSRESAGTWFKNANEHVQSDMQTKTTYDEEPPFYIDSHVPYLQLPQSGAPSRAFGAVPAMQADSEKEDLRDVIDDLTIENKKLKQKLSHRTPTSKRTSSRTEDKLFELRVHGMRSEKKRELEILLKNFATSLGKDSIPSRSTASHSSDQVASMSSLSNSGPGARNVKLLHTDSGYESNSHSNTGRNMTPVPLASKDHTIKSYLHDIPDILLPHESYPLTNKAKMALVVRRLEQLFTGKQASQGNHQQPIQQQEVSRSAAHGERQEDPTRNNMRGPEGTREAQILPLDAQLSLDISESPLLTKSLHAKIKPEEKSDSSTEGSAPDPSRSDLLEQRPTRPLDLDIGRAQIAQDNLEYIRHLGLQAPCFDHAVNNKSQWIYFNLLTSMAQLHTLNVTPDFVRRAIRKHSTKLELSKDLRQVRWKGGADTTTFSKETEQEMEHSSMLEVDSEQGEAINKKKSGTDSGSSGRVSFTPSDGQLSRKDNIKATDQKYSNLGTSDYSKPQATNTDTTPSAFDYKPLFHKHKPSPRREASSIDEGASSVSTESTGLPDRMSRPNLSGQSQDGDGMLTFFNNAYFCSDFSADKHPLKSTRHQLSSLADFCDEVLGIAQPIDFEESALRHHDACYFASQFATKFTPPKHSQPVEFVQQTVFAAGEDKTQPMEMEASGLGMIIPSDNFAIDVKVIRKPVVGGHLLRARSRLQSTMPVRFHYQVESARRIDLQPSYVPPPSYVFFASSSSSGHDTMDASSDGSGSSTSADEISPAPHTFLRQFSTESSCERDSDEDMEDDNSSIDLLRNARADNPEMTAAQEREYLLNHPGAAMDVSPSLAATVGTPSVQDNGRRATSTQDIRSDVDEIGSYDSDDDADDDDDDDE